MSNDKHIIERFERMFELVSREEFLDRKLIGGNIPFYIFDYKIESEQVVDEQVIALHKRLKAEGIPTQVVDLFDLCCTVIDSHFGLQKFIALESKFPSEKFLSRLRSTIDIDSRFIPAIQAEFGQGETKILLIKGVSKVYPMIRANELLNHLTDALESISTIVFYPGTYKGRQLTLFDRIPDQKYYRAHPIDELKI